MHEGWFTEDTTHGPVKVDTFDESRPHEGKVLGIVQAHADDMPLCSGGLVAKLVAEGYRAFIIQTTNDEKCGAGTIADAIKSNEVDVDALASCLGIEDVFNLGYRNHRQDENSIIEQRCRLIFLFRHLRVDTVMSFHPWAKWEENPDHYITGYAVESACWIAGAAKSFPEQVQAGIAAHGVKDKYYWVMRPGSPYNHVTDISPFLDKKIESMATNKSQGPAGSHGSRLKERLAREGRKLVELGDDDETADREYIRLFGLEENKRMGKPYGLQYAEYHYYFPPGGTFPWMATAERVEAYIKVNAVSIK
ncbi:MAG: PIG-L family deacetylase [Candidatus Latescibacterota bacterium]|jgi:LmbE family N-acetylglucosaminyl deacetylase|nr:PIG-L family deacetylase [Candidatus Latescibacterota bacterium]